MMSSVCETSKDHNSLDLKGTMKLFSPALVDKGEKQNHRLVPSHITHENRTLDPWFPS